MADDGTISWRELLAEAESRLSGAAIPDEVISARRIVEEASGHEGAEFALHLDEPATVRGVARFDSMLTRRAGGEPLQYVLGRWGFRYLDLAIDQRVLIPRPETEEVVGWAIDELRGRPGPHTVVDLGTGSGAIGLSVLAEVDDVDVWMTDRSADALAVARANLAGLGRRAVRGRLAEGNWFDALPTDLEGSIDVVVSNPPYVASAEVLPDEVADWEPSAALVAGPSGDEDLAALVVGAGRWLRASGVLVLELAPHQATRLAEAATTRFGEVEIRADLSDRPRAVIARHPR